MRIIDQKIIPLEFSGVTESQVNLRDHIGEGDVLISQILTKDSTGNCHFILKNDSSQIVDLISLNARIDCACFIPKNQALSVKYTAHSTEDIGYIELTVYIIEDSKKQIGTSIGAFSYQSYRMYAGKEPITAELLKKFSVVSRSVFRINIYAEIVDAKLAMEISGLSNSILLFNSDFYKYTRFDVSRSDDLDLHFSLETESGSANVWYFIELFEGCSELLESESAEISKKEIVCKEFALSPISELLGMNLEFSAPLSGIPYIESDVNLLVHDECSIGRIWFHSPKYAPITFYLNKIPIGLYQSGGIQSIHFDRPFGKNDSLECSAYGESGNIYIYVEVLN
jgi:hypothetical protein